MEEKRTGHASRLDGYVASTPVGLSGFPGATAKGSLVRVVLEGQPLDELARVLPAQLVAWMKDPPMGNEWVPEAHLVALVHAVCDLRGWTDRECAAWARAWSRALFGSPAYRILMAAPSPASALRSAGVRWGAFHRGSALAMEGISDDGVRLALRFPDGLFDRPFLDLLAQSLAAGLELSRALEADVVLEAAGEGFARFAARW